MGNQNKNTKLCLLCLVLFFQPGIVDAVFAKQNLTVPFQNVILNPNDSLVADYQFGNFPIIFCYENNQQNVGILSWPYLNNIYSSTLNTPLVINDNFQGSLADAAGTITILNNQTIDLVVNCDYAF